MMQILKQPLISEKNSLLSEAGVYAFEVDKRANKTLIKTAVEKTFDVKVASVRTLVCRKDGKRTRYGKAKVTHWKKAFIKLMPGEKIAIFEGA